MFNTLIETERQTLPDKDSRRIYIGGHSQGAMTSLSIFLRYPGTTPLGGVIIESGMMVLSMKNILTSKSALAV